MRLERFVNRSLILGGLLSMSALPTPTPTPARHSPSRLRLVEVGADSTAFDVVATLIVGPTEAILWDSQYLARDASRLADTIQASKKHLKAIILSHPDEDHVSGAAIIVRRFPGTPVYMTASGLRWFSGNAIKRFNADRAKLGDKIADSLVTPTLLPTTHFTVDGEAVDVIADLNGDMGAPMNSVLWIPSLRAALVGDMAFNGVHPWLGVCDAAARAAWRASLARIASLDPAVVVAGHKKSISLPDSPAVLEHMRRYLDDFDTFAQNSQTPMEMRGRVLAQYPDLAIPMLVGPGVMAAMKHKASPSVPSAAGPVGASTLTVGRWTGSISPPGGDLMLATFDVATVAEVPRITITIDGRGTMQATDVKAGATELVFGLETPGATLKCVLTRQNDGAFVGTCEANGASGAIIMRPPQ